MESIEKIKIGLVSDTHFGYAHGTEREGDAWEAMEEVLERIEEEGCRLLIHAGDVFDTKSPRPDDWSRALEMFSSLEIPTVAIHGNHERRGQGLVNPAHGLARSGILDYVNAGREVYEIDGRKIAVHGMGWVPEKYAKDAVESWNPEPVDDAFNILVLHQSISPFVYNPLDPPSLEVGDMPEGFDLYVNGHVHEHQTTEVHGKPFTIVGSTVTSQVRKEASENPPGFVVVELGEETEIRKIPLQSAREVYYREMDVTGEGRDEIREEVREYLQEIGGKEHDRKPLARIRIVGELAEGLSFTDLGLGEITEGYREDMLLSVGSDVSEGEVESEIRDVRQGEMSIDEMGFQILREHLEERDSDFRFEDVFEHLVGDDTDAAIATLMERVEAGEPQEEGTAREAPAEEKERNLEAFT